MPSEASTLPPLNPVDHSERLGDFMPFPELKNLPLQEDGNELFTALEMLFLFVPMDSKNHFEALQGICNQVAVIYHDTKSILPSVFASRLLETHNPNQPYENQQIIKALEILEIPESLGCLPKPLGPLIIGLVQIINTHTKDEQDPIKVVGVDVKNLKGINTAMRHLFQQSKEDISSFFQGSHRALADLVVRSFFESIENTGENFIRIGGDEVAWIGQESLLNQENALNFAQERVDIVNKKIGCKYVPHTKSERPAGIGVMIADDRNIPLTLKSIMASIDNAKAMSPFSPQSHRLTTAEAVRHIKIPVLFQYLKEIFDDSFPEDHSKQTLRQIYDLTGSPPQSIEDIMSFQLVKKDSSSVLKRAIKYVEGKILSKDPVTDLYGPEAIELLQSVQDSKKIIFMLTNLAGLNESEGGMKAADSVLKGITKLIQDEMTVLKRSDALEYLGLGHIGGGVYVLLLDTKTPDEVLDRACTNIKAIFAKDIAGKYLGIHDARTRYSEKDAIPFHANGTQLRILKCLEEENAYYENIADALTALNNCEDIKNLPQWVEDTIFDNHVSVPLPVAPSPC